MHFYWEDLIAAAGGQKLEQNRGLKCGK